MRQSPPHYKPGEYKGNKPYRNSLIEALNHFGLTSFPEGEEFWTLGGVEWHEFNFLTSNGIKFEPKTYHNVDKGMGKESINHNDDARVVGHSGVEFLDIFELWSYPRALCFDCTEQIVKSNESGWIGLIDLAIAGTKLSNKLCLNWNYMTGYGRLPSRINGRAMTIKELIELYEWWLSILVGHVEAAGFKLEVLDSGTMAPKERSFTDMLCGHCLITSSAS